MWCSSDMQQSQTNALRIQAAVVVLLLAVAQSQLGAGPALGPDVSAKACPHPDGSDWDVLADIPTQRVALDRIFAAVRSVTSGDELPQPCRDLPSSDLQLTSATYATSSSDTNPERVGMLVGGTLETLGEAMAAGDCQAFVDLSVMSTFSAPFHAPGMSYCSWLGVTCCLEGRHLHLTDLRMFPPSTSACKFASYELDTIMSRLSCTGSEDLLCITEIFRVVPSNDFQVFQP